MTTKPAIISTNRKTLQRLADDVNEAAGRTVEAIIQTGVALIKAKTQAGHGGWERLFEPKSLARPIRFSLRTAVRLMAIAKSPNILKAPDLALLPPAVTVLEGIAKLPVPILRAAYQGSMITPEITKKDVTKMLWLLDRTGTVRYRGTKSKKSRRPTEEENQRFWRALNYKFSDPAPEQIALKQIEANRIATARGKFFLLPSIFENAVRIARQAIPYANMFEPDDLLRLRRIRDAVADLSGIVAEMYQAAKATRPKRRKATK